MINIDLIKIFCVLSGLRDDTQGKMIKDSGVHFIVDPWYFRLLITNQLNLPEFS